MFDFTPLLGAKSASPASQSLLEFEGGIKVLIDVGWDEAFSVEKLKSLESHVASLSIILLTHATPAHIGAFAHCCKHIPQFTQIPIYATLPVISLGRTLLQDLYTSTPCASTTIPKSKLSESSYTAANSDTLDELKILLQPPTSEEIAYYFSLINTLKFSQPHQPLPSPFSPPLNELTITAYNAGHSLGGTIWHIQQGMESVVYAVDWNQVRENVFSGAAWLGSSTAGGAEVIEQLRKPTALICSAKGCEKAPLAGGRAKRDDLLLDMIESCTKKGGTVLIPTDSSARALELAYLLEQTWVRNAVNPDSPFKSTGLYFVSSAIGATMRYAASMLEWMDEGVVRTFEATSTTNEGKRQHRRTDSKQNNTAGRDRQSPEKDTPFAFKFMKLIERKSQVDKILNFQRAKVILASDASLDWGFSKEIVRKIALNPSNLVILTQDYNIDQSAKSQHSMTLGATLWSWYQARKDGVAVETTSNGERLEQIYTGGRELQISDAYAKALEGNEVTIYQSYLAARRQFDDPMEGNRRDQQIDTIDDASSSSSSSSEQSNPEMQGRALNMSTALAHANRNKLAPTKETLGVNILLAPGGPYDYDVRDKKGRESMFPYLTKRQRADDYGDLIRPEDYLRAEERDEVDGQDIRTTQGSTDENRFGQKRRWDDAKENGRNNRGKRRRTDDMHQRRDNQSSLAFDKGVPAMSEEDALLEEESDFEPEDDYNGPTKLMYRSEVVKFDLRIAHVDFSGIHDQRSLFMLIPLIRPRKLIIVGANASETEFLAEDCRKKLLSDGSGSEGHTTNEILCPDVGQKVSASMDTHAWTVKLSEALVRRLHWQSVRGLGIVTLMAQLSTSEDASEQKTDQARDKRQKTTTERSILSGLEDLPATSSKQQPLTKMPFLDVLPSSMLAATRSVAQPLHVGDLRLADLRKLLQSAGHAAEFRGEGTLVIDGIVAVRKSTTGQIEVEGTRTQTSVPSARVYNLDPFQAVKRSIYDGLAVIAGGE
ncbi:hypothetical protein MMC25_001331 [Agyrium rufum]|nr:hypothetical protein [Agyrium rufum]